MPDPLATLAASPLAATAALGFAGLLAAAALSDVVRFTIPNRVSAAIAGLGLAALAVSGLPLDAIAGHLAVGLGAFALGFALFAAGVWGGGDGKLVAAVALWAAPAEATALAFAIAIAGGALAVASLMAFKLRFQLWALPGLGALPLDGLGKNAPYGVAIALGALWVLPGGRLLTALAGG